MEHHQYKKMCLPIAEMKQYLNGFVETSEFSNDQKAWLNFNGFPDISSVHTDSLLYGMRFAMHKASEQISSDGSVVSMMHVSSNKLVRNECMKIEKDIVPDYAFHYDDCECSKASLAFIYDQEEGSVGVAIERSKNDFDLSMMLAHVSNSFMDMHVSEVQSIAIDALADNVVEVGPSFSTKSLLNKSIPGAFDNLNSMVENIHYNAAASLVQAVGKETGNVKPFIGAFSMGQAFPSWLNVEKEEVGLHLMVAPGVYEFSRDLQLDNSSYIATDYSLENIGISYVSGAWEQLLYHTI